LARVTESPYRRAALAVAFALLLWTAQDIGVWYLFIERRGLDHDPTIGAVYQQLHELVLLALVVAGVLTLRARPWLAAWFAGATWTLAYSGLADILYYWLALRPLPGTFPWLDGWSHILVIGHPATGASLLASSALWAAVWALALVVSSNPWARVAAAPGAS
jgi:hypothetical protein